jgi:hypothetical protein
VPSMERELGWTFIKKTKTKKLFKSEENGIDENKDLKYISPNYK